MVYDCFLFNDELDILKLRLTYLAKYVDYFVIAESTQTLSGFEKPLHFLNNIDQFSEFNNKFIHVIIPPIRELDSWGREYYQRNYLKTGLKECLDGDLIIIADLDEFINMDYMLNEIKVTKPCIIEMPLYYYFLNLKTTEKWCKTLISPFSYIKDVNIGDREKYFDLKPDIIKHQGEQLGWHFSYLFGYNIQLYINKLKSFSHQEYNTSYFLNPKRIKTCLSLGIDFLERNSVYKIVDPATELPSQLYEALNIAGVKDKLLYRKPGIGFYLNFYNFKYYIKFSVKPRLKLWLDKWLTKSSG
jgi:beta-1,4-mannosyl-glycoprotein beta-1,4-N-acetylglucosaminyltransferase